MYTGLSFNPSASNYIVTKMSGSELVKVEVTDEIEVGNPVEAILGEGKENGVIMDSNVRFYIETIMEFHSIYLNDIITKHKVSRSTYGNQNNITKF